ILVGTTTVSLFGTGVGSCAIGAPATPDGTNFGDVCTDDVAHKRLVVTNSGNLACTVSATACTDFAVSPSSRSVAPGASATFTVTFQPSVVGAASCAVTLSDGSSSWPA